MLCLQTAYKPDVDNIVTAASCTTNCLAPVVKVVHEKLGIKHGCITTIHNLTNTQTAVDAPNTKKSDLRRARWEMLAGCLLVLFGWVLGGQGRGERGEEKWRGHPRLLATRPDKEAFHGIV